MSFRDINDFYAKKQEEVKTAAAFVKAGDPEKKQTVTTAKQGTKKRKKAVSLYVDDDIDQKLEQISKTTYRSKSQIIRDLLREALA